ncbi:hypothetical protein [Massilibacteroides sp.]|uniref:hypothetical protein n=1 Tax=Massilibacteroides sp. TaxID=2034766 RepID=UPI002618E017|nr:hypothetical protein [Massilibacteroides sp.]MDD4515662.1 hypothetical protein [Massilibacteroides sp.]
MNKIIVNNGDVFGRLTIIQEIERLQIPSGQKIRRVLCKCECGKEVKVLLPHLIRGRIISCGCSYKIRDNESHTRLYKSWHAMMTRCKENYFASHIYFKRGIDVSDEFQDYRKFKKWALENGYKDNLQLDRIDNYKGYSRDNCRFVTALENRNNSRNTFYVTYKNRYISFSLLLIELGLKEHYAAILKRIKRGYSVEDAIDKPIKIGNYKSNINK